eukprot:g249.t1
MEPADLNNDGLTDLIVVRKEPFSAETEPPKSDLLLMNVGGALVDQTALYAPGFISNPSFARDVYIGDFDDDGWQDVVIANTFEQAPIYYRNRGNDGEGNWLGLVDESATRFPASLDDEILMCAVKGGDLDGDGDLDLYFVNYRGFSGEGTAKDFLFINDGNGNFTAEAEIRLGVLRNSAFGTEVEIKDMDNDGDNDIIKVSTLFPVSPWNANGVFVLFNEGDGFFSNWQNVSAPVSTEVYMIEIEDFNQDGQLDIFVVDDQEDFVLTANVINPDVSISYTSQVIPDLIPGISNFGGNIHAGDFDLDGDLDIAVADVDVDIPPCNSSRRFELARNDDGVFSYPYANETPAWATNVYDFAVMDVNNDGLLDLVTGNCSGYRIFQSDNCNPNITDLNRWQPLTLDLFIDQSGNVIPGATPGFLSPEWGSVTPFALDDSVAVTFQREGDDYKVYHNPGSPPLIQADGSGQSDAYQWGFATVAVWSSHLDPSDGVMLDISPAGIGNVTDFPVAIADYPNFYDQINGGTSASGYTTNPVTGQPYAPNLVPRGDYARVIAEFWADGPDSETPPGHWFTILNEYVSDHPDFEKRIGGQGEEVGDIEWYVKSYFMLGGAMHDAAVTSWGIKGWYDYLRPVSAIRAMADRGQSTDADLPSYDPQGIPLIDGYIELVGLGDPLAGVGNVNLGKIKLKAWLGHDVINNVDTDEAGVDWILAENWVPYQRPSFVTPNFAGYVSGHSTFSRTAATVLTSLTGTPYFPGGMGSFLAEQDEFLVFENGPSVDVELQWATYQDAANESALSRIWGGIHPPADDIPGRIMGTQIGMDAFQKAMSYFADEDGNGYPDLCQSCEAGVACDDEDPSTFDDVLDEACNCVGTPCPEAGTACDDGDATTFDDMEDGMCNCVGTPCPEAGTACDDSDATTFNDMEDGMCNCVGTPCPEAGTACDDGNATTFGDMEDGMCNCVGTPCPEAGTACDDSDATTFNDMEDGMCNCVGTPCPEVGTACDDGDATTFDDMEDGMCNCVGTPCPEAGTACDDGDATTFNDVEDGMCNCIGTPCPEAGTACDDGDTTTFNDIEDGMCNCVGTPCPEAGTACDDGDATTFNDVEDGMCNCIGTPCPEAGTSCDDGDATTFDDVEDGMCNCIGTPCPEAGTACDDGDATTFDDMEDGMCNCIGTPCPEAGTACDDGDATTFNDMEDGMCNCVGIPCPEAGTSCDDGDATTFDDMEDGMCNCIGTPCPEAGTACDDGDATTFDDMEDGMCNCIGTPCPEAGTSCDDGDATTFDDMEDGMCNCVGIPCPEAGTSCDDGDATTFDDMEDGMCNCIGTPCPEAGIACDDGDATTFDDVEDGMCNCIGTPCPEAGTACDDGDATTFNDMEDGMCNCVGTPCPEAGTACDDGDATTFDDVEDGMCNCVGTPCPEAGTACDDGDATTFNDVEDGMCNCLGTPCPEAGTSCDDGDATTFDDVEDGMCNCIGTPCPEAGTACDDGDATTFDDVEDGMCNCIGTPCPEAGTSCDDGDPATINDVEDGMCNCSGVVSASSPTAAELLVRIAPNPATDELNVTISLPTAEVLRIATYDSNGKQMRSKQVEAQTATTIQLLTADYPAGVYFLKVTTASGQVTKKFVVVH